MVIDVRDDNDTFRFADGGPGENIVHHQEEYNIAVISGEDGEAEVAVRDIDNLIEALRQVQKRAKSYSSGDATIDIVIPAVNKNLGGFAEVMDRHFGLKTEPIPTEVERFFKSDWIKHDRNNGQPVHDLDIVDVLFSDNSGGVRMAGFWSWDGKLSPYWYRIIKDQDGVPYVYNDGLEPWAEYVATDENGRAYQYKEKPRIGYAPNEWVEQSPNVRKAPDQYHNTIDHWTKTLRRVYR